MKFYNQFAAFAGLMFFAMHPLQAAQAPLHYEPALVQLSGTVQFERHYGPPNFGGSPRSDAVLMVPVLVLDSPVVVQGNPPDARGGPVLDGTTYQNVTRMQLTFPARGAATNSLSGQHVTVRGKLFEKVSAQNYTDVLIAVENLAPSVRSTP